MNMPQVCTLLPNPTYRGVKKKKKQLKKNKHHQERACWQCAWKLRLLQVSNNLASEDSVITSL